MSVNTAKTSCVSIAQGQWPVVTVASIITASTWPTADAHMIGVADAFKFISPYTKHQRG